MSPKKTSFPKQDIRVLLLEGVSQTAVEVFSALVCASIWL
jgi:D-3-phosphoglycerate dehydrogenase / 2-oxoglutarate reductase